MFRSDFIGVEKAHKNTRENRINDVNRGRCTFVITVGMLYNVCFFFFFWTQFGKQFVNFVFL